MREGLNMIGQANVCGITVIAESIAVTIAENIAESIAESTVMTSVTIADSISSNGITYRSITILYLYLYIIKLLYDSTEL